MLKHIKDDVDGVVQEALEATIPTKIISGQGAKTNVCVGGSVGAKHVVSPFSSIVSLEQENSRSLMGQPYNLHRWDLLIYYS
jgi:hypothetical protein